MPSTNLSCFPYSDHSACSGWASGHAHSPLPSPMGPPPWPRLYLDSLCGAGPQLPTQDFLENVRKEADSDEEDDDQPGWAAGQHLDEHIVHPLIIEEWPRKQQMGRSVVTQGMPKPGPIFSAQEECTCSRRFYHCHQPSGHLAHVR